MVHPIKTRKAIARTFFILILSNKGLFMITRVKDNLVFIMIQEVIGCYFDEMPNRLLIIAIIEKFMINL
ncbi:MAG: hypothetical protein ACJAZM_001784 [Cyclobacteriaceae bacterium]|jgi:hypothetical protein